jgi:polysaccharide biosynthesis protein PelG
MAGIGFQLQKILKRKMLLNYFRAYAYAGLLSSGPWVISIIGIVVLDMLRRYYASVAPVISQFQVSVTYLIALSLVFSGFMQHSFTRYIADQLYLNRDDRVTPNYLGILLQTTLISGVVVFLLVPFLFPTQTALYQLLFAGCFVVLCDIWLTTNLLSGIKAYRSILTVFALGYGITVLLGYQLIGAGLIGLMLSFLLDNLFYWPVQYSLFFEHFPVIAWWNMIIYARINCIILWFLLACFIMLVFGQISFYFGTTRTPAMQC